MTAPKDRISHEEFLSLAALIAAELDTTNPKEH